ncbi:epoxide hydrolase 1-like [Ostrinia furnacalis]|uniref:epoxide hydrolase 1-like n=1 Tax=Ostrinia furnacalis TaxID=93504 RepID=UPI00103D769B|nr:epoxide hydrolase 1-like [Ostrinia furnacalis]
MDLSIKLYRLIVVNLLTVYYCMVVLIIIALNYVKGLFVNSLTPKRKLEPPACLSDPKYGVHKYIKVNKIKLHYVESGDPSKPLMLFLHGFPEFWYSWRHQILDFQKDYWCIAVDMRGYGDSERPEGLEAYHYEELIEDVRDLIRQLGREKCILVAHDWGGLIACKFRDLYPDVLSGVVLLASLSREAWMQSIWSNPAQRKKSWYVFMYRMPGLAEHVLQLDNLVIFDKAMLVPGKDTITQQDMECYKYWFGKQFAFTPPVNYYRANFAYCLPEKHVTDKVPMLVIHAAKDPYIDLSVLDIMKQEYSDIETTVIEDCGHFLQQEEPAKVNKVIREFLAKRL